MPKQSTNETGTIIKLPPDIVPGLRALAKNERRSMASMAAVLIESAIKAYKEEKQLETTT